MMTGLHYFFVLITILTGNNISAQRISTEPSGKIILSAGQSQNLLCRSGESFDYCRFEIPGEKVQVLRKDKPNPDVNFQYYGEGLDKGQCGVTILRVSEKNHGRVYCSGGVSTGEVSNFFELEVALSPAVPEIELPRPRTPDGSYEAGTDFQVRCIVRDGRPAPGIRWFLDQEPITDGLSQLTTIETNKQQEQTQNVPPLFTVEQGLRRILRPEDNGRFLICQSEHQADREPKYAKHQLSVTYRPQPKTDTNVYGLILDRTNTINVTIFANPRPQVEWNIGGIVVQQGGQNERYAAYDPIDLGNGYWNVTLRIAGLTLEDTTRQYHLKAANGLGAQDYTIRISSSETPASSGLDVGAIVGIVVAIVIVVIIVLLLVFARVTGRWCFAAKSPKSPKSETPDEAQLELNTALISSPNHTSIMNNNIQNNHNIDHQNEQNGKHKINKRNNQSDSINLKSNNLDYLLTNNHEENVYNPTTIPIHKNNNDNQHNSSISNNQQINEEIIDSTNNINNENLNDNKDNSRDSKIDLLTRGNELGIPTTTNVPESRFSKWIPKNQRELIGKQAKLLSNPRTSKPKPFETDISDTESAVIKQANKSKRLPTFSAIFKKRNEKFTNKDTKKDNTTANDGQNEDEQRLSGNLSGDGTKDGDGNDNELKEDKQLVYAELVLKPADDKPTPPKKSTEYAEIVYVQKQPESEEKDGKK